MKETEQNEFSHIDRNDNPQMVDVGQKAATLRIAKASAKVKLTDNIIAHFNNKDIQSKKGPVFQTAILAGIMAAKKTGDLIPLCHPLPNHSMLQFLHFLGYTFHQDSISELHFYLD